MKNLRYPEIATENGISGKVYVQFVVNSKGQVEDVKVIRGVDPSLDKESIRVVMASPKWVPLDNQIVFWKAVSLFINHERV